MDHNSKRVVKARGGSKQRSQAKNEEGKGDYATISANSSNSQNAALQRLNQLQRQEKKDWKGIR